MFGSFTFWASWQSGFRERPSVFRAPGERYVLLKHDVFRYNAPSCRSNLALCFSRTGADDYVVGPAIVPREDTWFAYAQGIALDGKFYIAYSRLPTA